ncbi:TauD/TfdA family dioxygenase [Pseudomonas asplenii]|uniref:Taurine catabolism dioxygenase TauD, TfdA family n=1 Tax=Pseudomonas asplenii TaxID=53407 RepID=A0A1H6NXD7_9PSED|nr:MULTISPECIES: TauD/TfdA family dioxygenase [Pseudomonas]UZE26962.1 TauD/TfdA family dioxygenase [Pseudomonas asplenii]SEI21620.1 Taurine catabolism dioxygenase TauD, TfdA family [Pseudomonas fuscovaginae]
MRNSSLLLPATTLTEKLSAESQSRLLDFHLHGNKNGYIVLENQPIGDIPPTPPDRSALNKNCNISEQTILTATSILGEPIGYIQESNGALVNNFFPHKKFCKDATSDSYDTELDLHTENAFHEQSPDYLILLCLRQDPAAQAITYITSVGNILDRLSAEDIEFFQTEKYNFLSDYDAKGKNCRIDINKKQTVLYGDPKSPSFRFDPHFMVAETALAHSKMQYLRSVAWDAVQAVALKAGDMLVIDNRRTAHARSAFSAQLDGRDRWIQRTFVLSTASEHNEQARRPRLSLVAHP